MCHIRQMKSGGQGDVSLGGASKIQFKTPPIVPTQRDCSNREPLATQNLFGENASQRQESDLRAVRPLRCTGSFTFFVIQIQKCAPEPYSQIIQWTAYFPTHRPRQVDLNPGCPDDSIVCFERKDDAEAFLKALP
jgi:hypothetical protein